MKKVFFILILIFGLNSAAHGAIEISIDHRALFFGVMQLGEEKELADSGTYHNQISCSSTNGKPWYLKIGLLQPLTSGSESIPVENFKWQLVWTDGLGMRVSDPHQFKEFSVFADLVYTSAADEASGNPVNFQFKYYLKIPQAQISGVYNTIIRFTLTEIL